MMRASLTSAHVFAWLFVFQYFYVISGKMVESMVAVAFSYALAQSIAILLTPYTARRLRHGIRGMLINAMLALSVAFAVLASAFSGSLGSIPFGIVVFAVCMGIYRSLYWIPYELAAKKYGSARAIEFILACVPAIGGYVITLSIVGPLYVLAAASILALLAIVPLFFLKNTHEGFSWGYRETFRHLFTSSHRRPLLQAICNGFEGAALLLLWPVAIFVLLNWSYLALGLVLSATYVCTILARMWLKKAHVHMQTPTMLSMLTVSGWILRGTVVAPISIILVDTYYQSGSGVSHRGVDLLTAEQSADSNSYIDEFTALKDMGQGIGRIAFCVVLFFLSFFFSFAVLALSMFALTAILAVASIMMSHAVTRHAF